MQTAEQLEIEYQQIPADFPGMPDSHPVERLIAWHICDDMALHFAKECWRYRLVNRKERPVDIVHLHFNKAERLGWGEQSELQWVFRRVAVMLGWPIPDSVKPL